METNISLAFALTLFAGLSTGIGSFLAFFTRKTNTSFLSVALGFSSGVMIYVSFVEILPKAREILMQQWGTTPGSWVAVLSFFGGIFLIALIDYLVPSFENPHEVKKIESIEEDAPDTRLMRMGIFSALAIMIHNFPEGFATFTSAIHDPALGVSIAIAIAIHNIPEGIAVSIPVFYATGSHKKAFILSFASGLSEPLGALLGFLLLQSMVNDMLFGISFAGVAGIMVFISLDELLPTAREYGEHHLSIYGLIAGMIVMAISLLLFLP
jgi:ZIP family zinc transporter